MNQGKLEVVKQEMARVNVNLLGISKLKWTGMGEFNSDDHYVYYCGQESLRRNGVGNIVNKRVWNAVLGCSLNDRMISVHFQGKPFNITVIQVYDLTCNAEEAEVAEYIMWDAGLDGAQAGIKISRRNVNNLRYADNTTLMAESKEELKSLLMKMKEESGEVGLKCNIQKTKIMASVPSLHGK